MDESGWPLSALMTGRSALLPDGKRSAIAKHPVLGEVGIGRLGLEGDLQVNRKYHGGPEMAVHLYPLAHHAWWRERLGALPLLDDPGAFGGNLAVDVVDETMVRVGERFRVGSAVLEISQPRMPCATIERRFERKGMVEAILASGRCGWYFRVVEEGRASAGDRLIPMSGTGAPVTVREAFANIAGPIEDAVPETLANLVGLAELSEEWRAKARTRLARLTDRQQPLAGKARPG